MRAFPVLLLAAASTLAAPAVAQSWGDVVTADVTLAQDLQYDGIHPVGLTVAASGVRIDLGGHRIDGLGLASVGIHVLPGVDDVTITRGLVRRNQTQILLEGHATAGGSAPPAWPCATAAGSRCATATTCSSSSAASPSSKGAGWTPSAPTA
jgi:hypothetical protein